MCNSKWQTAECQQLEKILRKCIALSLGTATTTGLDAAEIESGIMPLDLRREELAVREIVKIMSKNKNEEIVKCLNAFKNKTEDKQE